MQSVLANPPSYPGSPLKSNTTGLAVPWSRPCADLRRAQHRQVYSTQLLLIWLLISFSYPGIGNASVEGRAAKVTTLLLFENSNPGVDGGCGQRSSAVIL